MTAPKAADKKGVTVLVMTIESLSKDGEDYAGPHGFATRLKDEAERLRTIAAATMGVGVTSVTVKNYTQWNDGRLPCRVLVLDGGADVLV